MEKKRVLAVNGTLIFKWYEYMIPIQEVLWRCHFRKDLQKRWQKFWAAIPNNGSTGNQGF